MGSLVQDVKLALRSLRRNPGFAAAALVTLALGIGGTCAVFDVVNDVFFRPLPFADESRLVRLRDATRSPGGALSIFNINGRHFLEMAGQATRLVGFTAERGESVTLTGIEIPETVTAVRLSPRCLEALGIRPSLGRDFTADEESAGEDAGVALISDHLWRRHFRADPSALGRTIEVDGRSLRIVGVLPYGYRFPYDAELWVPLKVNAEAPDDYAVIARLAPGATLQQARAELDVIAARMPQRDPRISPGYGIVAVPLRQGLIGDQDRVAIALLLVLGFFLLLACLNVAMLLLARSVARQKELAIRSALGASRGRQARQLLTESATLALLGGALGLLLAVNLAPLLGTLVPTNFSEQLGMAGAPLDWRVPAFAFALSLLAALLAGAAPALKSSRPDLEQVLRGSAHGAGTVRRRRLLSSFVAGQIALGVVLLCGAGLVIENFRLLQGSQLGFDPRQLFTAELTLPPRRYPDAASRARFLEQLEARLQATAGLAEGAITSVNPLRRGTWQAPIVVEGGEGVERDATDSINHRLVTPGLFSAMRIPILRGRAIGAEDIPGTMPATVISARLAARLWRGEDPLGKRLRVARPGAPWQTVVGVAGDVRDDGELKETWYLPALQNAGSGALERLNLMVRSALAPEAVGRALRSAVAALDPQLAVDRFESMENVRRQSLAQDRLGATAVSLFALLGLLLAAVGTYGVMAYALARRTREIGIRLALGAAPRDVRRLLLYQGLGAALAGIALGTAAALALHRLLAARLSEVSVLDPRLFAAVSALFLLVALVATLVPGQRAMAVDPAVTLREE